MGYLIIPLFKPKPANDATSKNIRPMIPFLCVLFVLVSRPDITSQRLPEVPVKNKLIRLAELIQEGFPENILAAFRSSEKSTRAQCTAITSRAIAFHQQRAESLWLKAGRKRTLEEKRATARGELAAFLFAYLTGDAEEYAASAAEALRTLGCQWEINVSKRLPGR